MFPWKFCMAKKELSAQFERTGFRVLHVETYYNTPQSPISILLSEIHLQIDESINHRIENFISTKQKVEISILIMLKSKNKLHFIFKLFSFASKY
jgi:hypothetical protein